MTTATATRRLLYSPLGPADHRWLYRDAEGHLVGAVLRWDRADGKVVRPVAHIEGRWEEAAMPEPRPLYRLPQLLKHPSRPVLVVEGEKAADAAVRALQEVDDAPTVTTWAGGCAALAKADWSPLRGREVRIWPDADEPGARAARRAAAHTYHVGATRIERLLVPRDWPEGHDAADLCPEAIRRLWTDPAGWEEMDVAGALARHRARKQAEAEHRARRRHRWTPSDPSPGWERRVERARSLTVLEVAQLLRCGEPVKRDVSSPSGARSTRTTTRASRSTRMAGAGFASLAGREAMPSICTRRPGASTSPPPSGSLRRDENIVRTPGDSSSMSLWTKREREIIALVRRGLTYQEVADELGISSTTVRTHVSRAARLLPGNHTPLRKILRMSDGPESTPTTVVKDA